MEGATLAGGTTGEFRLSPGEVSYGARGTVANLDLDRLGGALKVDALAKPVYDSRINGSFDVSGVVVRTTGPRAAEAPPALSTMRCSSGGHRSDFLGAVARLTFDANIKRGNLTAARMAGRRIQPGQIQRGQELDGKVTGTSMQTRHPNVTERYAGCREADESSR